MVNQNSINITDPSIHWLHPNMKKNMGELGLKTNKLKVKEHKI